ncbi:hypothetical protein GBA52_010199 [Prunus armeniaca]|nr:hypothetical protein GBA52_010199 [Prunus armeniaca]
MSMPTTVLPTRSCETALSDREFAELKHTMGESLSFMNMKDLKNLESKLEKGISRVRSRKVSLVCRN